MLGILLNALTSASKVTDDLSTVYNQQQNLFGRGKYQDKFTVGGNCTIQDVYNATNGILEFNDFEVPAGVTLKPVRYGNDRGAKSGPFSPLILKCAGTLTVGGAITSAGTGGYSERYDGDATFDQNVVTTGIPISSSKGDGFSVATESFFNLATYGANAGFFDNKTAFFSAGGGGGHNYKRGHLHHRHKRVVHNYGFASGGGISKGDNHCQGGAGGFVALYFEHLIIDGLEYGKDPNCNITRISANGLNEVTNSGFVCGGGSIIIAARNIVLTGSGTINSDALSQTGTTSKRYSFLNNPPQLCENQRGYIMQADGSLVYGAPTNTYFYDTGYRWPNGSATSGGVSAIKSIGGSTSFRCGGAGVCLGFKVTSND